MIVLPHLPYKLDALEPVISQELLEVHYWGHHKNYVEKYNKLITTEPNNIEDIEFNYYGHLLHSLFWENLAPPQYKSIPSNRFYQLLIKRYGNQQYFFETFIADFVNKSMKLKGSGWTALLTNGNHIKIQNLQNHQYDIPEPFAPILIIDMWEHSYYLDYLNGKKHYLQEILKIINWDIVNTRLDNV